MSNERSLEILEEIDQMTEAERVDGEKLAVFRQMIESQVGEDIESFLEALLTESAAGLAHRYPDVHPGELAAQIDQMKVEVRRINRRGAVRMRRLRVLLAEMASFGGSL